MSNNSHREITSCVMRGLLPVCASVLALSGALANAANGKDGAKDGGKVMEEVVVTGTRKAGLSPEETLSPIDVIGGGSISNQASFNLTDSLSKISPSLNTQRFPIADGTAFVRPVTLRNLSPDHTLVLVNGTRRHRSALVNLQLAPLGTVNQGSQGVDFSAFPSAAIKRVEVLRDGASAQYGSDAIAGVVNVILNDAKEGFNLSTQYGEYSEGDGDRFTISANGGLPLGDNGFVNLTIEHSTSDITSRGNARPDAAAVADIVGADQVPYNGFGQRWGDPDVEATKYFVNVGYDLSDKLEVYGNASYMDNETLSGFFYRGPVLPTAADNIANPPRTTLMTDANEDGIADPADIALVNDIQMQGLDPADYLTADGTSPSGYSLLNPIHTLFPGGYSPLFGADITDYAVIVGLRGDNNEGFSWDVRARVAENEVVYVLEDSINPSLGGLSPTTFNPGTLTQEETSFNADFVKSWEARGWNLGFGFEWRDETYKIGAGDEASIAVGPTFAQFGVGSDGFQGFPVESSGSFESESYAAYVDVEVDLTERLSGALALRYEDFDEFGSTLDWKLSGRFEITEEVAVRATANTGFRVPTPGQVNTLNTTTTADSSGNLIPSGTYPVAHPVAVALGSEPLDPEESTSFTLGVVYTPANNVTVTMDYYDIEIKDRIALQSFTIGAAELALLNAAGVPNANLLSGSNGNFFVNGFQSEVSGIDLNIHTTHELSKGSLDVDFRHNYNQQEVSDVKGSTIGPDRIYDLENQIPEHSSVLTFTYNQDIFEGMVRFNRYDDWSSTGGLFGPGDASDAANYDGEILVDLEARFNFDDKYSVAIGGENVFDVYPDDEADGTLQFLGQQYSVTSPFGFNGAFWYLRLSASF
ncbi:TonB-dependent receptor plug domain-containing protein [Pseudomaricurvus alcaniphilus]|uniref:TonB-dependent receptor plug domain-containing protein n=1 Tax=Pseudomaricurvus alcaniphilus TaxID=1166482 RepID=UPI001FB665E0|nr:TonB-dependent receptor [Pseudomaricurvus alcaniphilus]